MSHDFLHENTVPAPKTLHTPKKVTPLLYTNRNVFGAGTVFPNRNVSELGEKNWIEKSRHCRFLIAIKCF